MKATDSRRTAFAAVVWGGFLVTLGANLPGHMTYDSAAQLHEGHFGVRETWGPPLYAWFLGTFDRIVPGTGLYVAASCLVLFGSLAALAGLRARVSWLGVLAALGAVLTPQLLVYQGIVWKDVLFANLAIAGLLLLALAACDWATVGRRWSWLALSLVAFAAAAQTRQNGVIVAAVAALALGWIAAQGRWLRGIAYAAGGLVALALTVQVVGMAALATLDKSKEMGAGVNFGLRVIQSYDVLGAAALDPTYRLDALAAANPRAAEAIHSGARTAWSAQRVDFVSRQPEVDAAVGALSSKAIQAQWIDLVTRHPALYLRVRWEDFRWVTATPQIDFCLAVSVGIDAPAKLLDDLKIAPRRSRTDEQLINYVSWVVDTPLYNHVTWLAVSAALSLFLIWRRQPTDIAILAMQVGSLGFAACFLVISIACDYRYLYFCDLAAIFGLVYVALDLTGRERAR